MTSYKINIGLPGGGGRMGGMLICEIAQVDDLHLVAVTDRADSPHIGQDSGEMAGVASNGVLLSVDPEQLFLNTDVVIDFTVPDASLQHVALAAETGTAMVIGTTGLTPDQEELLRQASKKTAIVYCANTSVGVTLLTQLVEQVAAKLTIGWDIEILEMHHKHKIDAPSGTALLLGKSAAKARGQELSDLKSAYRDGIVGKRKDTEIGFAVLRGGDVVGEHTVLFSHQGERIELVHRATDRSIFASGALRASYWASSADPGLYSLLDFLKNGG